MIGFGIDQTQAEYVAEIKLRHLNREYILKRTQEIQELEEEIRQLKEILDSPAKIKKVIIGELQGVAKKYGKPRRSQILYQLPQEEDEEPEDETPDYPCHIFFTREGYFKKIIPQSLRMASEQKLKEGDEIIFTQESHNTAQLLVFTNKCQVYKTRLSEFADCRASAMGDYLPSKLSMEEGEVPVFRAVTDDYQGYLLFFFQNGKCAKVPLESYATKTNRKKLLKAYSDKAPLAAAIQIGEETELAIRTSADRMLLVGTAQIPAKATKDTAGVSVITLKKNQTIQSVQPAQNMELSNPHRYRVRTLPAAGALLREEDLVQQLTL